jgi:predicted HAD superfamily Cof-like phosphohydrolase
MSKSNFEKVLEFNKSFGVFTKNTPQYNIYDEEPKIVEYRKSLINEEVKEFEDSIKDKNFTESIDALCDILYVVYGAFTAFGVDADKAFEIVQQSNMSKLCKDEEEAIKTVEFYKQDSRYDSPSYRLSDDGKNYVVFNESTKKILKSINYTPVNFSELF